jgi:hypothetical protein
LRVDYKGVVGADSCCFTGDESRNAHAGYRLTFDVVPENGETWQLNLGHTMLGAHSLINEDGGNASTSITAVTGRARIGAQPFQNFNFTPSVTSGNANSTNSTQFTGSSGLVLQGTTAQTITVEFGWDVSAVSDAQGLGAGDEAAVRFGANDTIANGFTAGEYPGLGNRNIVADGHFGLINLTTVP